MSSYEDPCRPSATSSCEFACCSCSCLVCLIFFQFLWCGACRGCFCRECCWCAGRSCSRDTDVRRVATQLLPMKTSSIYLFPRGGLFCFSLTNSRTCMTHMWIEADFCVLFIFVSFLLFMKLFPIFPNAHFVAAAEVNRMLLRFLTRQTRSN
jgi:hypothetical protein